MGLLAGNDVSVAGAAALAGTQPEPARRMLDRLAGAALIVEHAPRRYAFHDLLRLFAAERVRDLAEAERAAATERYFEWCLRNVDAAARQLYPDLPRLPLGERGTRTSIPIASLDDGERATTWLDTERANLIAVITHTAAHGPRPVAWLLADALRGYCWLRVSPIEWRIIAEAGVTAASAEGDLRARATCHLNLGLFHRRCSEYQEAVEQFAEAARLSDAEGWLTGRASAVGGLSATYWMMGELRNAAVHGHEALELSRQLGSTAGQSSSLGKLGMIYQTMGRLAKAAEYLQQALALDRETGNRVYEALNLRYLGATYHALGRSAEAFDHLNQSLELLQCLDHPNGQGEGLNTLAGLHRDSGRLDHALDCARTALALARDTGERRLEAEVVNTLASICVGRADYAEAAQDHRHALDLARATGSGYIEVEALLGLASAEHHLGDLDEALTHTEHAATLARHAGYKILEGLTHTMRARLYRMQGRHTDAVAEARRALAIHQKTGHRLGVAQTLLVLAEAPSERRSGSVFG
jgi:tetratricopeptide (TPR) repeat protein